METSLGQSCRMVGGVWISCACRVGEGPQSSYQSWLVSQVGIASKPLFILSLILGSSLFWFAYKNQQSHLFQYCSESGGPANSGRERPPGSRPCLPFSKVISAICFRSCTVVKFYRAFKIVRWLKGIKKLHRKEKFHVPWSGWWSLLPLVHSVLLKELPQLPSQMSLVVCRAGKGLPNFFIFFSC